MTLYGSFSTSLPNEAVNDFRGAALTWKPVVIYVRDTQGTISLTVQASANQSTDCNTHYELVVYKKNILNFRESLSQISASLIESGAVDNQFKSV